MKKTAVVLMNMGGPDRLDAVEPFLYNLFSDHDIIEIPRLIQKPLAKIISKIRAKKTRKYYEYMGGKSPQKEQTIKQARKLQEKLGSNYKVVVAMRYWHPLTEEALNELTQYQLDKIILLPLYPQYSKTTTGSSFNEFFRQLKKFQRKGHFKEIPVIKINNYHNHPLFIQAWVEIIKKHVPEDDYFLLFSAHSLPEKVIKKGDPYKDQVEETVSLIMENFPDRQFSIAYQSKVGPVKWLSPMTDEEIVRLSNSGIKKIAIIPVTFVSEHSETLYELDYQYKSLAKQLNIKSYIRVPTLQAEEKFIDTLKDLVVSA